MTDKAKPKEFYLRGDDNIYWTAEEFKDVHMVFQAEAIHVVEFSALTEARAEIERLREALQECIADMSSDIVYHPTDQILERARAALEKGVR